MSANPTTSNNFLVTTDYPLDKVVAGGTAHFTVPATTNGVGTTPHGLPFTPLMTGSYSMTADYAVLYGINSAPPSGSPALRLYDFVCNINANATDIIFSGENYTSGPLTFYVRYYGMESSVDNGNTLGTLSAVDPLQLSTDYNYTKLYKSGYVDYPSSGSFTSKTDTIPHGLGRVPQALSWGEENGQAYPIVIHDGGVFQSLPVAVSVDENNLYVTVAITAGSPALRVHYRVYLDA